MGGTRHVLFGWLLDSFLVRPMPLPPARRHVTNLSSCAVALTVRRNPLVATVLVHDCSQQPERVGIALAVTQLVNIPASSLLAYIADRTRRHTLVYRTCILLPIIVSVALFFEVDRAVDAAAQLVGGSSSHSGSGAAEPESDAVLWLVGGLLVALSVFGGAAITPMLSGATMTRLDEAGQTTMFGRLMIFRALGWSSGSFLGGAVYQLGLPLAINGGTRIPGAAAVVLCGLVGARSLQLLISLLIRLPEGGGAMSSDSSRGDKGRGGGKDGGGGGSSAQQQQQKARVSSFLGNPHVLVFFLCMGINGIAGATYDNYVILFAKQQLNADGYVLG